MPIYFSRLIKALLFGKCGVPSTHTLPQEWAPFDIACYRDILTTIVPRPTNRAPSRLLSGHLLPHEIVHGGAPVGRLLAALEHQTTRQQPANRWIQDKPKKLAVPV